MNVSLTPELEEFVKQKVESGRYHSASEVIRDALRIFEDHEEIRQRRLEQLKREIAIGIDQLDRGEYTDGEEVFAKLRRMSEERRRSKT